MVRQCPIHRPVSDLRSVRRLPRTFTYTLARSWPLRAGSRPPQRPT